MPDLPIAFLIIAHADPAMLTRLIERMYDPQSTYIVHINRASEIQQFRAPLEHFPNVHFVPDEHRIVVKWAGFSFTEAVFACLQHALRVRPDTQRFVLMSGADYPIKPLDTILAEIREDQEIMTVTRALDRRAKGFHNNLAKRYFLGDSELFNVRTAPWLLRKFGSAVNKLGPIRRAYPLQLYHGASWWSLTREAVDILLKHWGTPLSDWFRYAQLPDEMLPQTLLMHSSRRDHIKYNQLTGIGELDYEKGINGPHYADWRHPNPHLPRHLGEENFEDVRDAEPLFMRKVDSRHSKPLLDLVDEFVDQHAGLKRGTDAAST